MQAAPITHVPDDEVQRLRAENSKLKEELEETRKATNRYLQNVAHQLTAPLNAIKWSIEALSDQSVHLSRKQQLLRSIYSQGTILVHLIKNFALMSNLEADRELGQYREKPEPIDILRLAINLANDFQPQAAETEKKILVDDSSFQKALRGRRILLEKNLVAQALSNLLENAVKYGGPRTTISVGCELVSLKNSLPELLAVRVTSVGIPISATDVKKLTERGFRGLSARHKVPAGTGIGLYLADRVMSLHNGTILIRTKADEASFLLAFPINRLVA